jgi:hypothetical protein
MEAQMTRYLVTYHGGGGMPESAEGRQQMMAAFGQWVAGVGDAMVDPGTPLGATRVVAQTGTADAPADGPIGGYTVIEAADLDTAVALVRPHPFIARGGILQVLEAINLPS